MIVNSAPPVDTRDADDVLREFWQRSFGYVPEWEPPVGSAGQALAQIFAQYVYTVLQRLNQAPDKNKLAFLDLVGMRLVPASQARAPIVFQLSAQATDSAAPAGTKVAAPPPPGSTQQIVFETETATGVAAANLVEVVSLWPGRDQYIDHSANYLAKSPFTVFQSNALQPTPHGLYLGHSTLLSFAGNSRLEVEFELEQGSSSGLEILWQYWDGAVWRGFKSLQAACLVPLAQGSDGTNGLMYSGSVRLSTDCAQTAVTEVNNVSSYWIRGQLTQPLPPDPEELLPVVDSIRLRTTIEQDLEASLQASIQESSSATAQVVLASEGGGGFEKVTVTGSSPDDAGFAFSEPTGTDGAIAVSGFIANCSYSFTLSPFGFPLTATVRCPGGLSQPQCVLTLKFSGLKLDTALVDGQKTDVSKPFFPFGQQPQPGATFYFSQQEILGKSGSSVRAYLSRTVTPQDLFSIKDSSGNETPLDHTVSWEYWNGFDWTPLAITSESGAADQGDMDVSDVIDFIVPDDLSAVEVNNQLALWIRVRLVSGGFGFTRKITFNAGTADENTFNYVITQAPALSDFRLAYVWQTPFSPLEQVLTWNDFQYEDHTDDARWPGNSFSPYNPISEVPPAVYFGLTQPLPVNLMGIYMDIVEQSDSADAPPLVWEYYNGAGWREPTVIADETRNLSLPGIVSFVAPDDSVALARFDNPLHWMRARLKEDGPPQESTLNAIYLNAAWASQRQTYNDVPLGASTGMPDQVFNVTQVPVLPGERVEVREFNGAQANVEWRTLALELGNGQPTLLNALEAQLSAEGSQTELIAGALRLIRDRNKHVTEAWVHWYGQQDLFFSGPKDRHYVVDAALGRFLFGDGTMGRIPPAAAAISVRQFQSGGGLFGNLDKGTIKQLLGSIGGVQAVFNARAAEGGADGETLRAFAGRAPDTIRHRGRALTPPDYETMAYEASAGVARARAIPGLDSSGRTRPGWVTVIIIPQSGDPSPQPSFGLREEVQTYLQSRAPAGVVESLQINVIGPTYLPIDIEATLAAKDPNQIGQLENEARAALENFLNPLTGGPGENGWDLGRGVFLSDIAGALTGLNGLDYVQDLSFSVNGVLAGSSIAVPRDQIVAPGQIRLNFV